MSNTTVSGNIISGKKFAAFQVHGGQNNVLTGNIVDLQSSGNEGIVFYQKTDPEWTIPMTGNRFTNNIIIARSAGDGNGYNGNSPNAPAIIQNNDYWNYASPNTNIQTTGNSRTGNDTNPIFEDPQLSTWNYTLAQISPVYDAPVSFSGIGGGWGPARLHYSPYRHGTVEPVRVRFYLMNTPKTLCPAPLLIRAAKT